MILQMTSGFDLLLCAPQSSPARVSLPSEPELMCSKCIHLEEYFDYRNHPCIVSELYGMSVFDFLKQNSFQPFPEKHIQDFAKSLLRSVECERLPCRLPRLPLADGGSPA